MFRAFFTQLMVIIFFTSHAQAEEITNFEGRMSCKINYKQLLSMEDGKPVIYSGFNDSPEIGSSFKLLYKKNTETDFTIQTFYDRDSFPLFFPFRFGAKFINADQLSASKQHNSISYLLSFESAFFSALLHLRKDEIRISKGGDQLFVMSRYYKDDWTGTQTTSHIGEDGRPFTLVFGFACRHKTKDVLDDILNRLLDEHVDTT